MNTKRPFVRIQKPKHFFREMSHLSSLLYSIRVLATITITVLLLVSCTPTVESETNAWYRNLSRSEQLQNRYPNLKVYLQEDYQKALEMKQKAETITNQEAKIKALGAANALLKSELYKQLNSSSNEISNIESHQYTIRNRYSDELNSPRVIKLLDESDIAVANAKETLQRSFNNRDEAISATKAVKISLLKVENSLRLYIDFRKNEAAQNKSSSQSSKSIEDSVESPQNKNQKVLPEDQNKINDKSGDTIQIGGDQPSTKMCTHCQTQNKADAKNCMNCRNPF